MIINSLIREFSIKAKIDQFDFLKVIPIPIPIKNTKNNL